MMIVASIVFRISEHLPGSSCRVGLSLEFDDGKKDLEVESRDRDPVGERALLATGDTGLAGPIILQSAQIMTCLPKASTESTNAVCCACTPSHGQYHTKDSYMLSSREQKSPFGQGGFYLVLSHTARLTSGIFI